MADSENKKQERKRENTVIFKEVSPNQIFCYFKECMVCELRKISEKWIVSYRTSKLEEEQKKEIVEKWESIKNS